MKKPYISSQRALTAAGILLCGAAFAGATPQDQKVRLAAKSNTGMAQSAPKPAQLVYERGAGQSQRYEVLAIFHGHIPPFATKPDSEPINLKAKLEYVASVQKVTPAGANVTFRVTKADLSVLDHDMRLEDKPNPEGELPFPIALADVQKALNVTATLRPDGSIARLTGGDTNQVKINIGFELRKLFLLTMPVVFPNRPVRADELWKFDDGVLGHKPGSVTYSARINPVPTPPNAYFVQLTANNVIEDRRDKNGKPVTDAGEAVDSTTGNVDVSGTMKYVALPSAGGGSRKKVRVAEGTLTMNATIHRKKTNADPGNPEDLPETNMDVRAQMRVRALNGTSRATTLTAAK